MHTIEPLKNSCLPLSPPTPHLINDGLHVRLVFMVAVEQRGPLLGADAEPRLHGHADDLPVVLSTEGLVRPELEVGVCVCVCGGGGGGGVWGGEGGVIRLSLHCV